MENTDRACSQPAIKPSEGLIFFVNSRVDFRDPLRLAKIRREWFARKSQPALSVSPVIAGGFQHRPKSGLLLSSSFREE